MKRESAYCLSERAHTGEGQRLSDQAELFLQLEWPLFASKLKDNARVADVGCGSGEITRCIAQYCQRGEVVGYDADAGAVETCRAQATGMANLQHDLYRLGAGAPRQRYFDVCFTRLLLLHLSEPQSAVAELASMSKIGGLVYLVDTDDRDMFFEPAVPWRGELLDALERAQNSLGGTRRMGRRLTTLLEAAGLADVHGEPMVYDSRRIGAERYHALFHPVAAHYLQLLVQQGELEQRRAQWLTEQASAHLLEPKNLTRIVCWHGWGVVSHG